MASGRSQTGALSNAHARVCPQNTAAAVGPMGPWDVCMACRENRARHDRNRTKQRVRPPRSSRVRPPAPPNRPLPAHVGDRPRRSGLDTVSTSMSMSMCPRVRTALQRCADPEAPIRMPSVRLDRIRRRGGRLWLRSVGRRWGGHGRRRRRRRRWRRLRRRHGG